MEGPPAWFRSERWLLGLVAAIYLIAFPYHPGLRSPNELSRLWQARALVEHHSLSLNEVLREYGRVGDLSVKDGRYYSSKAPLLSFLAAPVYGAQRALGSRSEVLQVFFSRLLFTVLPTLALLLLLRRFLRAYVSAPVALAVTATYALGSLAFSYSLLFMSHQATAVLLFSSFFACWRVARAEWPERKMWIAGAAAGAAIAAEYTSALGILGLVVYVCVDALTAEGGGAERIRALARRAGWVVVGALPFLLGLMAYHQACFGHPLHSGYKYLADAAYQPWHLGGFLGIRYPDPSAFLLSFFSPLRGLFALSPFLLLALPGLRPLRRARALWWMTVALLAGYAYFTSSFSYASWGWTTGPRHLTGLVPFLLLPAALFLEQARGAARGIAIGLCAASVVVTGLVTGVNYIPDDVSTALYGLAVPLLSTGYLPPSVLSLLGVPTPWAGWPVVLGTLAAAGGVALVLLWSEDARARVRLGAAAALTLAVVLGLLRLPPTPTPADQAAVGFLQSVWGAPPGEAIRY